MEYEGAKKCRNILKHLLDFKGEKVKGKNVYKFDQFPCGNLIFSSNFSNLTCQNQGILCTFRPDITKVYNI